MRRSRRRRCSASPIREPARFHARWWSCTSRRMPPRSPPSCGPSACTAWRHTRSRSRSISSTRSPARRAARSCTASEARRRRTNFVCSQDEGPLPLGGDMKTYFGRPEDHLTPVPRTDAPVAAADLFKRGREAVLAFSPRFGSGGQRVVALPGLTSEQRVLLRLVDGRLSIARISRLAGLSEDAAAQALNGLCQQGVLVRVEPTEVT